MYGGMLRVPTQLTNISLGMLSQVTILYLKVPPVQTQLNHMHSLMFAVLLAREGEFLKRKIKRKTELKPSSYMGIIPKHQGCVKNIDHSIGFSIREASPRWQLIKITRLDNYYNGEPTMHQHPARTRETPSSREKQAWGPRIQVR